MNIANRAAGAFGGAATGFQIGAATGIPHLAGIGAIIGGVAGLFGGGGSSGGGGVDKKFRQAAKYQNKITYDSLKRDAALAIQANEKAAKLYDDLRKATFEEDLKNYELAIEQRQDAYNKANDAYKESVDVFNDTVEYNDISATMAMNDAKRVHNQNRQSLNERAQLLSLEMNAATRDTEAANELIESRISDSIYNARLNSKAINTQLRAARRDGKNAIEQSTRSFESATRLADLDLKIKNTQLTADKENLKGEMQTLKGEKNFIIASAENKQRDILASLDNSIAESDFAQNTLALAQDERYAEAVIQTDQLRRQGLLAQGVQLAKGQAGRSAAKSIQGLTFANQQSQALIASALVRADANYVVDKAKLAQSIDFARYQGKSELKSTAISLRKSKSEFAAAGFRMQAKQAEFGARALEQEAATERLAQAGRDTVFQNRKISNDLNTAMSMAEIDLDKLNNGVLASQNEMIAEMSRNNNRLYDMRAQTQLSYESLAFAGASLDDELKINKERIDFDKMLANRMAAANVLDEPRVPDLLPPPVMAPELVQQPLPEIDWNKIKKAMNKSRRAGQAYNPGGMSEFQALTTNILSIGEQAANVVNAFKPPTQPIQPQELFPMKPPPPTANNFAHYGGSQAPTINWSSSQPPKNFLTTPSGPTPTTPTTPIPPKTFETTMS